MDKAVLSDKIISLYIKSELSAREISDHLGITIKTVYSVLRKKCVPRRKAAEYTRIAFERKPLSFAYKTPITLRERNLCNIALAIYWCEGFQTEKATGIDFANSNPTMVKVFLLFLRNICHVNVKRLRCYLYCYSNQNPRQLLLHWSRITGIPKSQFTKPYIRNDYRLDKINKMPYGLVHIRYADKKLLLLIKQRIQKMANDVLN